MSRSEDFDSEFWSDPDVALLTVIARYLYVWTWTNPRCNMSGAYQITPALIAAETGLTADEITQGFTELEEHRFAFYDGRVVWVRSRVKRLRQKTGNIAKSIGTHLLKLPAGHPFVRMFAYEYQGAGWLAEHIEALDVEPLTTVEYGSGKGRVKPHVVGDSSTLKGVSADTPRDGQGLRQGQRQEGGPGETTATPEVVALCEHLAARMRANDEKAKVAPTSERWLTDMRLLVDRDGRTPDVVRRIINFAQADDFWRANILSPNKLRDKFPQLLLKEQGATGKPLANSRDFSRFDQVVGQ